MPELPEVETIKRDLEKLLPGKIIRQIEVKDPTVLTGISPNGGPFRKVSADSFKKNVIGKHLSRFHRRGKYLIMEFSDQTALIFHLRMTGQLVVRQPSSRERIVFYFDEGLPLCFADTRRFGEIFFSCDWKKEPRINSLGVEPLNGSFTVNLLKEKLKDRSAKIHSLLLDQRIVAGIGNIYAAEALFLAGIRPNKTAGRLSKMEVEKLVNALKKVLNDSIEHRGYTMNSYLDANGQKGNTQEFALVYGKQGESCVNCGGKILRKVISGRGVAYCAVCQK